MAEKILITGASGLLGQPLVDRFAAAGFEVLAQYHRHRGRAHRQVRWLAGDFSSTKGSAAFLKRYADSLAGCSQVIHNYGPIAEKATVDVTGSDLLAAFQAQIQPALDITRLLLRSAPLRSALFIAFEESGQIRPYKKILGYAMAKSSLLLLSRSLAAACPGVRFNVFSPPTLKGAAVAAPGAAAIAPEKVAARIFQVMKYRRSGCHYRFAAEHRKRG
jgi:NAD(P)-dependent dehydrogenase (short-subunit alcohol dehydrogenase family)